MSNELAVRQPAGVQLQNIDDVARVSRMFAESGFFTDSREAAQCGVKIMAGAAWGIDPFTAMVGIHIIGNKPTVSAGLMAAAVKGHPRYDYRVRERSDQACRIEFFEGSESLGEMPYTIEMAKRAGLLTNPTWQKYPEAMLFARAMSAGVRTFCPDVLGATVYTPEEVGAQVDEDGLPVDVEVMPPRAEKPVKLSHVLDAPREPEPESEAQEEVPVPDWDHTEPASDGQKIAILNEMKKAAVPPKTRMPFLRWFIKRPLKRIDEMSAGEADAFIEMVADGNFDDVLANYAVATAEPPEEDENA